MKLMNLMLYTVFSFQLFIIILMSSMSISWRAQNPKAPNYLQIAGSANIGTWFKQLLVFWVAYSHMIPISLYVIIEVLKINQSLLINKDVKMYDEAGDKKFANCKNSDLIEELGQVEFIFSDKTGTLTSN